MDDMGRQSDPAMRRRAFSRRPSMTGARVVGRLMEWLLAGPLPQSDSDRDCPAARDRVPPDPSESVKPD